MQDIFDTLNPVDEKAAPVSDIFDQLNPVTAENKSSSSTPETDKAVAETAAAASRMPATGSEESALAYQRRTGQQPPPDEVPWFDKPANAILDTAKGFVTGIPDQLKMMADPWSPDTLHKLLGGGVQTAAQIKQIQTSQPFSQEWWNGVVPVTAMLAGEVGGVRGSFKPIEKPPIQTPEAPPVQTVEQTPALSVEPKIEEVIQPEKTQEGQAVAGAERPQETETLTTAGAETTPPAPETLTGIAQRVHAERADLGRQGEILPGEGVSAEEMVHRGRFLVESGANPDVVLQQMKETGHLSGDSLSILRAKHQDLGKLTDQAHDEWIANPDNPQARMNYDQAWGNETAWAQQIKPFQTEWHKIGQAMQGEADINTGSFSGLRRGVFEEKGRDVLPDEVPKLTKMAERVQQATKEVDQARSKYDEIIKQDTVRRVPKTVDQLREHFSNRLRELTPC